MDYIEGGVWFILLRRLRITFKILFVNIVLLSIILTLFLGLVVIEKLFYRLTIKEIRKHFTNLLYY